MSDSLRPHGLQPTRLLHPWDFPGKSTGVGCHFLLQGIFPTQGLNPGLPLCRWILLPAEPQGKLDCGSLPLTVLFTFCWGCVNIVHIDMPMWNTSSPSFKIVSDLQKVGKLNRGLGWVKDYLLHLSEHGCLSQTHQCLAETNKNRKEISKRRWKYR